MDGEEYGLLHRLLVVVLELGTTLRHVSRPLSSSSGLSAFSPKSFVTRSRTSTCCSSMPRFASMATSPSLSTIDSYCSTILPWNIL